jgi:hypothetical protein
MSEATLLTDTVAREPREWAKPDLHVLDQQHLPTSELAECTCPEFCERDHTNE